MREATSRGMEVAITTSGEVVEITRVEIAVATEAVTEEIAEIGIIGIIGTTTTETREIEATEDTIIRRTTGSQCIERGRTRPLPLLAESPSHPHQVYQRACPNSTPLSRLSSQSLGLAKVRRVPQRRHLAIRPPGRTRLEVEGRAQGLVAVEENHLARIEIIIIGETAIATTRRMVSVLAELQPMEAANTDTSRRAETSSLSAAVDMVDAVVEEIDAAATTGTQPMVMVLQDSMRAKMVTTSEGTTDVEATTGVDQTVPLVKRGVQMSNIGKSKSRRASRVLAAEELLPLAETIVCKSSRRL